MHLSIHSESPGFKVDILIIDNTTNYKQNLFEKLFFGDKNPPSEIPLQNYVFIDDIFYYNEYGNFSDTFNNSIHVDNLREFENKSIINRTFWLGTDKFGRDVLSRLVIGARISFFIGFISVLFSNLFKFLLMNINPVYHNDFYIKSLSIYIFSINIINRNSMFFYIN
jgi:peptide/nickel transport system permease protein